MKKHSIVLMLLGIVCLFACNQAPQINFTETQPTNVSTTDAFKQQYIGQYQSVTDSSTLIVEAQRIIRKEQYAFAVTTAEFDSIKTAEQQHMQTVTILNQTEDSVYCKWEPETNVFEVNEQHQLKHFKGQYFLNYGRGDYWEVQRMALTDDLLTIGAIELDEVATLQSLTEVEEITGKGGKVREYIIHPTKKEFKAFLKQGGFRDGETYQRIGK